MPNEKRRIEKNVQRMEDELNMMKEAVSQFEQEMVRRDKNWLYWG